MGPTSSSKQVETYIQAYELTAIEIAQVRNRHMSKRETEKLVKEVWREKMLDSSGGKEAELPDFLFTFLQKKLGILSAVVEVSSCCAC